MRAADWNRDMPHHRHGALPLSDSPMMRLGEVEIHHVDLAGHFGPDGWPDSFVAHILAAASDLSGRLPGGPSWAIAAWLAGRPGPATGALSVTGGELPQLSPWP
jgi:hypothetical protein